VHIPPLRERRDDIPILVNHFVERLCREQSPARGLPTIAQDAMRRLMAYHWPGNVRQLENVVERAIALTPGRSQIEARDLPPELQDTKDELGPELPFPDSGLDLEAYINTIELSLIRQSLERTNGNKRRAADLLNIKRTTLVEKLKRLEKRPLPEA
jgi:DNA-binding NtrC family response regulator